MRADIPRAPAARHGSPAKLQVPVRQPVQRNRNLRKRRGGFAQVINRPRRFIHVVELGWVQVGQHHPGRRNHFRMFQSR